MTQRIQGACLCGAVTFHYAGASLWAAHCHCLMCQRAHGAGVVTWVGVAQEQFTLDAAEALKWYQSSEEAERGFCSSCGSSLFFRSSRWPGEMHIARANFEGDIDREPSGHVYWASHAPWLHLGDELP